MLKGSQRLQSMIWCHLCTLWVQHPANLVSVAWHLSQLWCCIAGEVLAFGATPQAKPLLPVVDNSIKSELATQHVTPKQEFMVMTTAGQTARNTPNFLYKVTTLAFHALRVWVRNQCTSLLGLLATCQFFLYKRTTLSVYDIL